MESTQTTEPLFRREWTAETLRAQFSPRFTQPHKASIMAARCPDGPQRERTVTASRWPTLTPMRMLRSSDPGTVVETKPGGYGYGASARGVVDWWVNFAADDLFAYYAGQCFAQDEIQVLEHPVLGSVREALLADGLSTRVTDRGSPTPFLITGAERRIRFHTGPQPELGRTNWLYGRDFARASKDEVMARAEGLEPPTKSNVLVIEAPAHGYGEYRREEVNMAALAAYSGFAAAHLETQAASPGSSCVVHTGFWGCGAYGGNHAMMTAVQLLAARLAGIDRLCFYLWDSAGTERFLAGQQLANRVEQAVPSLDVDGVLNELVASGLQWGSSDGN